MEDLWGSGRKDASWFLWGRDMLARPPLRIRDLQMNAGISSALAGTTKIVAAHCESLSSSVRVKNDDANAEHALGSAPCYSADATFGCTGMLS